MAADKNQGPWQFGGEISLGRGGEGILQERNIRLLEQVGACGSITAAAKAVGVSYKTAWDHLNAINQLAPRPLFAAATGGRSGGGAALTEDGQRLITLYRALEAEQKRLLEGLGRHSSQEEQLFSLLRRIAMRLSAKNVLHGRVASTRSDGVLAEVVLKLPSGQRLVSLITSDSLGTLDIKEGDEAYGVIKASSVLLAAGTGPLPLSARNQITGTVRQIQTNAVSATVTLDIGGGDSLCASLSADSIAELGLAEGFRATAIIQAGDVLLGIG